MKKAFTLLSTILLVFIFSIIAVNIYELKSINSINIQKQYKYIQAKNHLNFLEEYVKSLDDLDTLDKLQIKNEKFEIIALIEKVDTNKYEAQLSVKAMGFDVRVYKKLNL